MKYLSRIRTVDILSFALALCCVVMGLFFYARGHSKSILLVCALGFVAVIGAWLWYRFKAHVGTDVAHKLFPIVFVAAALVYAFALPPGSVPDEPAHFCASYYYSNLITNPDNPELIRAEDYDAVQHADGFMSTQITVEHYDALKASVRLFAVEDGFTTNGYFTDRVEEFTFQAHPPQLMLPSALGITLAKCLNLSSLLLYYLGMMFNLAFCVFLIIMAVRLTPVGKNAMMVAALLPMTLHLIGSYSYDGALIGYAFLLTSLLLRGIHSTEQMGARELILIALVGCLLAPCKALYTLIVFLALFMPSARFASKRSRVAALLCMIVLPFLCVALFKAADVMTLAGVASEGSDKIARNYEAESGSYSIYGSTYTIMDLISNPVHAASLFLGTTPLAKGWFYLQSLVGGSLGWFQANIIVPDYVVLFYLAILALSIIPSPDDSLVLRYRIRIAAALIFVCGAFAILLSMCLGWTFTTDYAIEGVQGRYFLPLVPMFILAVRGHTITSSRNLSFGLVVSLAALDAMNIGYIVSCI